MAFQHPDFSVTRTPIPPVRLRGVPAANKPQSQGVRLGSIQSASTRSERPSEDIYAQSLEDSGLWAKSEDGGLIYRWNDVFWEEVSEDDCLTTALRWLRMHFPEQACDKKAAGCYRTSRLVVGKIAATEHSRCIIPCKDGWLELIESGFVRVAPDRSIGVTYAINVALEGLPVGQLYQPQPFESGMFSDYLDSSLPDLEVRRLVQQYAGYTLIPSNFLNLQVAMVFIGSGGDGKGVMTGLLRRLHRKTCAMNLKSLDGFGAEGLVGATLALVDEGPCRGVIDDERIKTMISGDALDINRKHRTVLTYSPIAKWIISANDTPRFGSAGQAIERRFLFAPWTASLNAKQRIPNLEAKIAESDARRVLDWALAGALAVIARRGFDCPPPAQELKRQALESMDTVLGWAALAVPKFGKNHETAKQKIYDDYAQWCSEQGQNAVRAETFWKRLRAHLNISAADLEGRRPLMNGKRILTVRLATYLPDALQGDADEEPPFDKA